jgi:hypothetical protein
MKTLRLLLCLAALALPRSVMSAEPRDKLDSVYEAERGAVVLIYVGGTDGNGMFQAVGGSGSGFLTREGVVVTANHVVGTAAGILMSYRNVFYMMKPLYKDHANDIAFLYPILAGGTRVEYDHLKGLSSLEIKEVRPRANQDILLIGYPKGFVQNEPKRTLGRFKSVKKDRYMEGVDLYECDLPVMEGFSGGPVFTGDRQLIGLATAFENRPNAAPYLITYVAPVQNLLGKIRANFTPQNMSRLRDIAREIPSFTITPDNCPPPREEAVTLENLGERQGNDKPCLTKKSPSSSAAFIFGDQVKAANVILDFLAIQDEKPATLGPPQQMDVYIKYLDPTNYVSVRFDLNRGKGSVVYAHQGQVTEHPFLIDMPVIGNSFYNLEIYTIRDSLGVYFDNIPVYYDNNLPIQSGQVRLSLTKNMNAIFPKEAFAIRIPKEF